MLEWIASGNFQIALLGLVVAAVIGGVAATAIRQRRALPPPAPEAAPVVPEPVTRVSPSSTLAVLEFDEDPKVVTIARPRVMIGRHSDDDIRIRDVTVSRHHALLELDASGQFEIHNQTAGRAEPNQLLVNGVYKEHSVLSDGDLVTLGGVTFRFRRSVRQVA